MTKFVRPSSELYPGELSFDERSDVHRVACWTVRLASDPRTGGPDVIQKQAWSFYRTFPVSAYVGSSKNLKDLEDQVLAGDAIAAFQLSNQHSDTTLHQKP